MSTHLRALACLVILAGCDPRAESDAGPPRDAPLSPEDAGRAPDDAGAMGCEGHAGFATEGSPWAIVEAVSPDAVIDRRGSGTWITPDADGDGWMDVLVADPAQLGWRLHRGGPTGFAAAGTPWAVPDGFAVDVVVNRTGRADWLTARVDGDGALDALAADPGELAWRLHRGGAGGFDAVGSTWTLPGFLPVDRVLERPGESLWSTRDVDGDGVLDVLYADPGALAWRLHRGGVGGFDPAGTAWAIPDGFPVDTLIDRASPGRYLTLDVDGDGWLDALVGDPANLAWRLHRGSAIGFDFTGTSWRVPDSFPVAEVIDRTGSGQWTILDADGDGVLDALLADPDNLAWRLHQGGDEGFDAVGTTFSVPEPLPVSAVIDRTGAGERLIRDVDGDGRIDLLVADPGQLRWRLHRGGC